MEKILLGTHITYRSEEQLLSSVKESIASNAKSGAFYVSNSRGYNKYILNIEKLNEAKKLAKENGIDIRNYIIHSPLVGNIANTDPVTQIHEKTIKSYLDDLKTLHESGMIYYNFHPGSNEDRNLGIKTIANGINKLHEETKGNNTILLLETMMAKGNYIGRKFEDLSEIINLVKDKKRIGVCLDTCHVWDAGYDIKNNLQGVLSEFDQIIGLSYLKALHVNDSMNDIGSNKDRHAKIGEGMIGVKALRELIRHPKLINLPKAIESPKMSSPEDMKIEIEALL